MKTAFLFPGQGSQYIGMGKTLLEKFPMAKKVYEEADDALGFSLSQLILNGSDRDLTKTENTQPALLTASIAYYRVLQEMAPPPDYVAGHSLGEYSALVAADAMDFQVACQAVQKRGQFMQEAVPEGKGAMAAFLGLQPEPANELIAKAQSQKEGILSAAGFNSPGQVVLSGDQEMIDLACELASEFGAKRATLLQVSAPFHCPLMKPAEENLAVCLKGIAFKALKFPYVANADAKIYAEADDIRALLLKQVCLPVLWQQSITAIWQDGARHFIEVGPGRVLSGLTKRCLAKKQEKAKIEVVDQDSGIAEISLFSRD